MRKALLVTLFLGATVAFAGNTYRVELFKPISVNGTQLKQGECKLQLIDNKVVFKQGKTTVEAPVKVEANGQKFLSTTVSVNEDTNQPNEIRLGGTNTKLLFESPAQSAKRADDAANGSK